MKLTFKQAIFLFIAILALVFFPRLGKQAVADSGSASSMCNVIAEPGSVYWQKYCTSAASSTVSASSYSTPTSPTPTSNPTSYYPTNYYPTPTPYPTYYPTVPTPTPSSGSSVNHWGLCNVVEPGSISWYQNNCQNPNSNNYLNSAPTPTNYYPNYPAQTPAASNIDHRGLCNVVEPGSLSWYQNNCENPSSRNYLNPASTPAQSYYYPNYPAQTPAASNVDHRGLCNVVEPGSLSWYQNNCNNPNSGNYYPAQTPAYYPPVQTGTSYYPPTYYPPAPTPVAGGIHYRRDTVCDVAEIGSPYWTQYCQ